MKRASVVAPFFIFAGFDDQGRLGHFKNEETIGPTSWRWVYISK